MAGGDKNVKIVTAAAGSRMEGHVSRGAARTRHNAQIVPAGSKQTTSDYVQLAAAGGDQSVKTVTATAGSGM